MAAKKVSARAGKAKKPKGGGGKASKAATAEKVVVEAGAAVEPVAAVQEASKGLSARRRAKETTPALAAWRCHVCKGGFVLIAKPISCPICYTQGSLRSVEAMAKPEPAALPDMLDNSAEATADRMAAPAAPADLVAQVTEKIAETYYQQPSTPQQGVDGKAATPAQVATIDDRAVEIDELIFDERELTMLESVEDEEFDRFSSHIRAFDRVTDGGLVVGGVVLLAGEKGSGKTTLSTHIVMEHCLKMEGRAFLCSGEEPLGRFLPRAKRLGYTDKQIKIASKRIGGSRLRNIESVLTEAEKINPTLLIVDSMPTIYKSPSHRSNKPEIQAPIVMNEICEFASAFGCAVVVIGRLTQGGKVAGGEEWLYDTDGCIVRLCRIFKPTKPPTKTNRIMLSCDKNRFGAEDVQGFMIKSSIGLRSCGKPKFLSKKR